MESREFVKKYLSAFEKVGYRNGMGASQLFSEFVFFNTNKLRAIGERHEKSINEFKRMDEKYSDEVKGLFSEAMLDLVASLSEEPDDYLGKLYMRLGANKRGLNQFFTPFHVSKLMAEINLGDSEFNKKEDEPFTISDPTCGSGSMLIASVSVLKRKNINYAYDTVLHAQDLDPLAASMCYLQLSALGAAAIVHIGNTITMEIHDSLPTIGLIGQNELRQLSKMMAG